jgi:type VI secretion system FHA domain protein
MPGEPRDHTTAADFADPAPIPPAAPVVRQRTPRPAAAPPPRAAQSTFEADPFNEPDQPPAAPAPFPSPREPFAAEPHPPASPFDEPDDAVAGPAQVVTPRPAARSVPAADPAVPPPAAAVPNGAAPPAGAPTGAHDSGALTAFFKGAELSGANPADPLAMMTGLGQAFRAMVSGLRAVLIARATIKGEFRIEQTMIRARGNNPLKFSANDDDALTALLGVGRRTDMAPAEAIEDSLRDLRLHELATMAAMQVAVRAMLDELSPDKIRAGTDQGGMAVLPAQRKARAWDAFEAKHAGVVQALVDDFDSIFGKSFARAYERALDEISQRERQ